MIGLKTKNKYLIVIAAVIAVIAMYYVFSSRPQPPSIYDDFAKCLTEKGATLYGAYWCPHCKSQKELFGSSLKYVTYVECDPNGDNANPTLCKTNGITGYPTWIINGTNYEGEQSLERLGSLTGCSLPSQ
jgi:glutaredoxin